jgi:hypothetical protein
MQKNISYSITIVLLVVIACAGYVVPCAHATNTYAEAIAYAKSHPTRDGSSWKGWCASLMWRAGALPESAARDTAYDAYLASSIVSEDCNMAPAGAFHWWKIGADGHVAMAIDTAGWALMASTHVQELWGEAIGIASVSTYSSSTGAEYLGWSYDFAGAEIADVHHNPVPPGPGPGPSPIPHTTTAQDGIPGTIYYMRQQLFASKYGYQGPLDGALGPESWAGTQRGLAAIAGYQGPDDGVPGPNTYEAMQRVAAKYGYQGPIDGELGPNSYRGFATFLNTL